MKLLFSRWTYLSVLLVAMAAGGYFLTLHLQERALHVMPTGLKKFNLTDPLPVCGRWKQHMPATREAATYHLYIEARKLWRSKIAWQLTREENTRILHDVSLAAERGDWGARALLAHFYQRGLGTMPSNRVLEGDADKSVAIVRQAAAAGQPWGLFDLGVAYEHGYGGVHSDKEIAWAYYLKAAQLGSPEAQLALADAYLHADRLDDEMTMVQCAYRQGHGIAASRLATRLEVKKRYEEAIKVYQDGVRFGNSDSASSLWLLFADGFWSSSDPKHRESLSALGIVADPERAKRYKEISNVLDINPDLKLTRLDKVLPLPPAKLPEWGGVSGAVELESNESPTY